MDFLIREVKLRDLEDLHHLAFQFDLSNFPRKKSLIIKKIKKSQASFKKELPKEERNYIFVLENKKTKKVIGASQILTKCKKKRYLYLKKGRNEILHLYRHTKDRHELGGLILDKKWRKGKERLGAQIGLVRFLYIFLFKKEFEDIMEVGLTSIIKNKKSDFWRETGFKLFDLDFEEGLRILRKNPLAFFSLFPKDYQVSLKKLSKKGKRCLKEVHHQTLPAYKALMRMGFKESGLYHLLDGGLFVESDPKKLKFFKKINRVSFEITEGGKGNSYLIAQQNDHGFFATKVKGSLKKKKLLVSSIPENFVKNKSLMALDLRRRKK